MPEKEYIEREPLQKLLETEIKQCERDFAESEGDDRYEQAVESRMTALLDIWRVVVNKAPADAVEVVRCKDCKHRYVPTRCALWYGTADNTEYFVERGDDFYCSYGEAKMNGKGDTD